MYGKPPHPHIPIKSRAIRCPRRGAWIRILRGRSVLASYSIDLSDFHIRLIPPLTGVSVARTALDPWLWIDATLVFLHCPR